MPARALQVNYYATRSSSRAPQCAGVPHPETPQPLLFSSSIQAHAEARPPCVLFYFFPMRGARRPARCFESKLQLQDVWCCTPFLSRNQLPGSPGGDKIGTWQGNIDSPMGRLLSAGLQCRQHMATKGGRVGADATERVAARECTRHGRQIALAKHFPSPIIISAYRSHKF